LLAAITILATATALSPTAGAAQQSGKETESSRAEQVSVRVDNNNWLDVHVYAVASGAPMRSLGLVTSNTSVVFHLPATVTLAGTDLRIVADPVGGNELYVSNPVMADPESEVVVTLQQELGLSNTRVEERRVG